MAFITPQPFQPGFALEDGSLLNAGFAFPANNVDNAITATGSTSAGAYVLNAVINNCTTVAASTGVALKPNAAIGCHQDVFNYGANTLAIYTTDSSTIDGTAGATGTTLTASHRAARFWKTSATTWISALWGAVSS